MNAKSRILSSVGAAAAVLAMAGASYAGPIAVNFALTGTQSIGGTNYNIYDMRVTAVTDWTSARMIIDLTTGSMYQDPNGGTTKPTPAQVALTMDVVQAIQESRDMTWGNVNRALAYFKHAADISIFDEHLKRCGLPCLPTVIVNVDICRGDLLFEIELDAVAPV